MRILSRHFVYLAPRGHHFSVVNISALGPLLSQKEKSRFVVVAKYFVTLFF